MGNMNKSECKVTLDLGSSFWIGISFAAGCFGFGWLPFWIAFVLMLLLKGGE
jgi:hypothetical protein